MLGLFRDSKAWVMRVKMNEQPFVAAFLEDLRAQHPVHHDRLSGLGLHGLEPHRVDEPCDAALGMNADHVRFNPNIAVVSKGSPEAFPNVLPADEGGGTGGGKG